MPGKRPTDGDDDLGFVPSSPSSPAADDIGFKPDTHADWETELEHAANAATMGFQDEIGGAIGAGVNFARDLPRRLASGDFSGAGDALAHDYRFLRDASKASREQGGAEHPGAAMLGTGAGLALSLMAPTPAALKPFAAGEDAGALARIGAAAGNAAVQGGIAGLGNSDADLTRGDVAGALGDAAKGAGVGALLGGGLQAVGEGAQKLVDPLKKFAAIRAGKAAGNTLADFRALGSESRAVEQGQQLLDQGAVRFGDSTKDIAERLGPMRVAAGERVGEALRAADTAGASVNVGDLADSIEQKVIDPLRRFPANRNIVAQLEDEVGALRSRFGTGDISASEAEALKRSYDPFLKWDSTVSNPLREAMQRLRGVVAGEAEKATGQAGEGVAREFSAAKRAFSNIAPAQEAAADQALRMDANRWVSPSDYMAGIAGALRNPESDLSGGVSALLHKIVRERGSASAAVLTNGLANFIQRASSGTGPLAQWAPALQTAAQRGPQALAAIHESLSQSDPRYREAIRGLHPDEVE